MLEQGGSSRAPRALQARRRRRQGRNLRDLTQAIEARLHARPRAVHGRGEPRAQERGAHARPHDYPDRDDENFLKHTMTTLDGEVRLDWKPVTMTKWQPKERTLLVATDSLVRSEYATMTVALKIWRFDASTGERELRDYEVEAPEWACLLDVLDLIKDKVDGSLAYRKSCRMMICGSCGMRMDGAAVLACRR